MGQRSKVLIIDDEEDICLLMKAHLLKKNYEVAIAHSLDAAFHCIEEGKPDIIFLDRGVCNHLNEDITKLKEVAPDAELIVSKPEINRYLF